MGMLDFFNGIAVKEAKQDNKNELKRLKAQEQRLKDMREKYTDIYQKGRSKAQIINIINDIDKVLGDNNAR